MGGSRVEIRKSGDSGPPSLSLRKRICIVATITAVLGSLAAIVYVCLGNGGGKAPSPAPEERDVSGMFLFGSKDAVPGCEGFEITEEAFDYQVLNHQERHRFNIDEFVNGSWYIQEQQETSELTQDDFFCGMRTFVPNDVRAMLHPKEKTFGAYWYNNKGDVNGERKTDGAGWGPKSPMCLRQQSKLKDPTGKKLKLGPCHYPNMVSWDLWVVDVGMRPADHSPKDHYTNGGAAKEDGEEDGEEEKNRRQMQAGAAPGAAAAAAAMPAFFRPVSLARSPPVLRVDESDPHLLVVRGHALAVSFERRTGLPVSLVHGGDERLDGPLELSLWRPLNDNELGAGQQEGEDEWEDAVLEKVNDDGTFDTRLGSLDEDRLTERVERLLAS